MLYADYTDFTRLYGSVIQEPAFNRLSYDASREIDFQTTGVDGIRKLSEFFPTDPDDVEAVKRCCCALVDVLFNVEQATRAAGVIAREDGTYTGRAITSINSGSESISFATAGASASVYSQAASSEAARQVLLSSTVKRYLSGAKDSNGVNLLYLGVYPLVSENRNAL